jgi:hypothetical protein
VLHFATIDWERFTSKIRWYQCWEFLQNRWDRRLIELYRWYHKAFHIPPEQRLQMPSEWTDGYGPEIDLLGVPTEEFYRWDKDLIRLFGEHGTKKFRRLAIWDVDWNSMCSTIKRSESDGSLGDPRSKLDRWIHAWLERTQPCHSMFSPSRSFRQRLTDRLVEKLLSLAGW